jgi:hypothetical protein
VLGLWSAPIQLSISGRPSGSTGAGTPIPPSFNEQPDAELPGELDVKERWS